MWISPNHPNPPIQADAPVERGQRLATLPRGQGEELRVALAEYQGHVYVSLRLWIKGTDGAYWPIKGKGISIRIRELSDVISALERAQELADA